MHVVHNDKNKANVVSDYDSLHGLISGWKTSLFPRATRGQTVALTPLINTPSGTDH